MGTLPAQETKRASSGMKPRAFCGWMVLIGPVCIAILFSIDGKKHLDSLSNVEAIIIRYSLRMFTSLPRR